MIVLYGDMAPPRKHDTDEILDAARALVLHSGPRAASVAAIATASGAPVGTLYHRFGNRDGILATVWLRAIARFQEIALQAGLRHSDPVERGAALAGAFVEFARAHRDDARILIVVRREDLLDAPIGETVRRELEELNAPLSEQLRELVRDLYGRVDARSHAAVTRAVVELPGSAVRRYAAAVQLPEWLAADVADDARTLLASRRGSGHPGADPGVRAPIRASGRWSELSTRGYGAAVASTTWP
jgi:AcrR family transcriptional regulator